MRVSVLAVAVSVVLGVLAPMQEVFAQRTRVTVTHTTYGHAPVSVRRTIARPVRGHRWSAPPRGSWLVRGRYWNPAIRWKTDPYTRSVYAVYRGEVWFLDPSSGWAYTIDRYGRIYTCDPAYRAIYSLGLVADWRGEIPYFFGYFAPDDGYYALPRYRYFVSYYSSPSYRFYDYGSAYDYWWNTYDDWFYSPRWRSSVRFSYWDTRHVRYDRHYRRDVYIDGRGNRYVEREPVRLERIPGRDRGRDDRWDGRRDDGRGRTDARDVLQNRGFASADDAYLPVAPVSGGRGTRSAEPPNPRDATRILARQPAAPEVQVAPAIPVNAAEQVAENTAISSPVPTIQEIVSMEQAQPAPVDQPVSTFDSVPTIDTTIVPEPIPVAPVSTTEIPPLTAEPAPVVRDAPTPIGAAEPSVSDVAQPQYSEPAGYDAPATTIEPTRTDSTYAEPARVEPETLPSPVEPAPAYSEPAGYDAPAAIEPAAQEPGASEPAPVVAEPGVSEPAYAEPESSFSAPAAEPEPVYSEPEPSYSQPAPEPAPAYSEPEPGYAEPESSYSPPAPEPEPAAVEPSYSEPEPSYSEPEPSYSEPEPSYSEPEPSYSEPEPSYSEPEPSYSEPEPSYSEPEPSYSEPEPSYSEPEPSYSEPEPSYSEPEPAPEPERDDSSVEQPQA